MPCINGNFVSNIVVLILETAKFWEIWVMRMTWCCMQCIVKNNVVSGREDESKNIFWLPTCVCKKLWLQIHHFGWSAWIVPKHLTKLIGLHYGPRYDNMGCRSIWFGFCNAYTLGRQAQSETMTLIAVDSIFAVVYVKDVCLARVYSVRC